MAFDSTRKRVVLFGGETGEPTTTYLNDTWEWNGDVWVQVADTGPSPRRAHAITFDSARQRVVLFGGFVFEQAATFLNDTWEWDGEVWTQMADTGVSPRNGHAMEYDSLHQRAVLFGGASPNGLGNDTWQWDGEAWTQVADTGPAPRALHAMAYDSVRHRIVLFGGVTNKRFNDTWEWDGQAWTQVADTGPVPRSETAMTYMGTRTALFGGVLEPNTLAADTWEWDGQRWTQRQNMGPPKRGTHAMAYDSQRERAVLFGGFGGSATPFLGDTWELAISQP
jgi:hypothetical protein